MVQSAISVEDEIMNVMAIDLAKELDESLMATILTETGWIGVEFYFKSNEHAVDVRTWLYATCTGEHKRLANMFVFEKAQDAEWFILKWQ